MGNLLDEVLNAGVDILEVAKTIAPNGKLIGNKEYRSICPFHDDKNPSYHINILNGKTICFGCGHKSDIVRDYCAVRFNAISGELLRTAKEEIIKKFANNQPQTRQQTQINTQSETDTAKQITRALQVWEKSLPKDSLIERYFSTRGLKPRVYENIRLFVGTEDELFNNGRKIPIKALISRVVDINGNVQTLHITKLVEENGRIVRKDKKFFSGLPAKGGIVWLGNPNKTTTIGLAEGLENALSIRQSISNLTVGATLSATLMPQVVLPTNIKNVYIFSDNDYAGLKASEELKNKLESQGIRVSVYIPPETGQDFNDILREKGEEEILRIFTNSKVEPKVDLRYVIPQKFNPRDVSEILMKNYRIFVDKYETLWFYDSSTGLWIHHADSLVKSIIRRHILAENSKSFYVNEVLRDLKEFLYENKTLPEAPVELIPLNNGVYNLNTDEFLPYEPDFYLINKIPVNYNPSAKCRKIDKFFNQIVDDSEELWEILAYTLYRRYPFQKFFLLYGSGANGKSSFTNLLENILGEENCSHVSLKHLSENRFATADLQGKFVNISEDETIKRITNDSLLKALTGWDTIRAERKNQNAFYFKNYSKILIQINTLPKAPTEATVGFYRRVHIINFNRKFEGKNDIKDLVKNIISDKQELEGAVIKAIEKLKELIKNNFQFKYAKRSEDMAKLYKKLTTPLETFIENFTRESNDKKEWVNKGDFIKTYNLWLAKNHLSEASAHEINKRMHQLGYRDQILFDTYQNKSKRVWRNLAFIDEALSKIFNDENYEIKNTSEVNDDEISLPF